MAELTEATWQKIEHWLPWNLPQRFRNLSLTPHWFAQGDRFWYCREAEHGPEYVVVDASSGAKAAAFDHAALRAALAAEGEDCDLRGLELVGADRCGVTFALRRRVWRFEEGLRHLHDAPSAADESLSPDGRRVVFRRDHDLWLRDLATGVERRLTATGEPHFEWGKSPDQSLETILLRRRGIALPPIVLWSPDSRKIFTYQLDEREVRVLPLLQHVPEDGSKRPVLHELRNAFTGDEILPMAHQAVIDVVAAQIVPHAGGPVHVTETSGIEKCEAWWSADSARVYHLDHDRFEREITLVEIDAATGAGRRIVSETSETFVDVNMGFGSMPNIRVLDRTGEAIWFSQRDGWAHLYLVDLRTGATRARITQGEWVVRDLLFVDEAQRRLWFHGGGVAGGPNPYCRAICSVDFDGSDLRILTPEPGDHWTAMRHVGWADIVERATSLIPAANGISPDARFFVHTVHTMDGLPRSMLRRADGTLVAELETASSTLPDLPFPEAFSVLAADGQTPIHGAIWLPSGFDPQRRYPVLDMIYPGPSSTQVFWAAWPGEPQGFAKVALARAIAELGIAVIMIDARGTPYRSKAFHDLAHGNLQDPGFLTDHVAALEQLFASRLYLDRTRVGIMGHSAGGHAAARALLAHPEVYGVAVASAGSHDPRCYNHCWPEKWQGPLVRHPDGTTNYDVVSNSALAGRLRGKLLLGHGDMDENVHPAVTQQFAAALVAAGKDFDLLITPNDDHSSFPRNPYVIRRELGFLVRNLGAG